MTALLSSAVRPAAYWETLAGLGITFMEKDYKGERAEISGLKIIYGSLYPTFAPSI